MALARKPRSHFPGVLCPVTTSGNRKLEEATPFPFRRSLVAVGGAIKKVEDGIHRDRSFAKAINGVRGKLIEGRKRKYRLSFA